MNENALTHLLFTTLEKVDSMIRARFLSDVVGLAGKLDGPATVRTQARWEDAGQKRAIVGRHRAAAGS